MTIFMLESAVLSPDELNTLYNALPIERQQRTERITNQSVRRESIAAAYLTLYALAVGENDGLYAPDSDCLLSQSVMVSELGARVGWPVDEGGKPFAKGVSAKSGRLYVSLSHSDGLVAVGVASVPLGVDVERFPKSAARLMSIATRFHPNERERLAGLPEGVLPAAFCRLWACKESVMKLCGRGLSLPLSSFCIEEDATCELEGRLIQLDVRELNNAALAAALWA